MPELPEVKIDLIFLEINVLVWMFNDTPFSIPFPPTLSPSSLYFYYRISNYSAGQNNVVDKLERLLRPGGDQVDDQKEIVGREVRKSLDQ